MTKTKCSKCKIELETEVGKNEALYDKKGKPLCRYCYAEAVKY